VSAAAPDPAPGARTGLLAGRVALVSGAARGQGRSHAVRIAQEGGDLVLFDVCGPVADTPYPPSTPADLAETVELARAAGARVHAAQADARDAAAVAAVVEAGVAELGGLDVVVANAGIVVPAPAVATTPQVWDAVVGTNLTGVWFTVSAALPHLLARGRGSIVITSSANGGLKAPPNLVAYAAAKFGVVGIMRTLAQELGPQGIRVNTVHPTAVATPMIHNEPTYRLFAPAVENPTADDVAPVFAQFHTLPVPWIEPVDVSNAVVWLCSDEARHVTGVALPVDAGLSAR
jgi:SDR family mycofactocin-dependent oxidoreductase